MGGEARIADLDHLALTRSLGKRSGSDCGDLNGSHLAFNWSPGSPLPPQASRALISQYPNLEPQIATLCAKSATTTVSPSPKGRLTARCLYPLLSTASQLTPGCHKRPGTGGETTAQICGGDVNGGREPCPLGWRLIPGGAKWVLAQVLCRDSPDQQMLGQNILHHEKSCSEPSGHEDSPGSPDYIGQDIS